jgi:hypothetical protein
MRRKNPKTKSLRLLQRVTEALAKLLDEVNRSLTPKAGGKECVQGRMGQGSVAMVNAYSEVDMGQGERDYQNTCTNSTIVMR